MERARELGYARSIGVSNFSAALKLTSTKRILQGCKMILLAQRARH
jgi:diketogulonate reductase-like aldo/keto reductase